MFFGVSHSYNSRVSVSCPRVVQREGCVGRVCSACVCVFDVSDIVALRIDIYARCDAVSSASADAVIACDLVASR